MKQRKLTEQEIQGRIGTLLNPNHQCQKAKYQTSEVALQRLKFINEDKAKNKSKKKLTAAYLCERCGMWHLTSASKAKRIFFKQKRIKK